VCGAVVTGSLAAVAGGRGRPLAEQFLYVEHVLLFDTSSSMSTADGRAGRRRIDVAREHLARLQAELPGKLAIVAFGDEARFVPGGVPPEPAGGTDLAGALRFARRLDVPGVRFLCISDGEPDAPQAALEVARTFRAPISTIYVGPEGGEGQAFLARLARAVGGRSATAARAAGLADAARPLLLGPGTATGGGDE
jgi:hypothetical protein